MINAVTIFLNSCRYLKSDDPVDFWHLARYPASWLILSLSLTFALSSLAGLNLLLNLVCLSNRRYQAIYVNKRDKSADKLDCGQFWISLDVIFRHMDKLTVDQDSNLRTDQVHIQTVDHA